ncbi:hypothetical protein ACFQWB_10815 [Paenibacillus thermoaerophilus]|uniref:Uncharacterized protein n=1 Tax=Paenibacillus thermoaerophilus TaxID=1215385 RepID=A0ABW2V6C4_9BACL|nr:hypothetical protein [Paenibacillus thermoaerophilus]TMV18744.1 hypothetical protein FE781_02080 [Paenibacillus thermoaerophilus]
MHQQYQSSFAGNQSFQSNASKFQPTGYVQSYYNPSSSSSYRQAQSGYGQAQSSYSQVQSSYGQAQSAYGQSYSAQSRAGQYGQSSQPYGQSYHLANYRGNQQGHDSYLQNDWQSPSSQTYAASSYRQQQQPQIASYAGGFAQQQQQQQPSWQSPQSFHLANYRGNQQGHDSYLRSDSHSPVQSYAGFGSSQQAQSYRTF